MSFHLYLTCNLITVIKTASLRSWKNKHYYYYYYYHLLPLGWKSFSWVFKRGLVLFFLNKIFSRFFIFHISLSYYVILSWYHQCGLSKAIPCLPILLVSLVSSFGIHQSYLTSFLFQRRQFRSNCVKTLLWKLLRKLLQ